MRLSYSTLYQTAKNLSVTIERDMVDFQQAGIDPAMFENFKSATDKVMTNFDQNYLFDKMELTSQKDELETQLRQDLRKVFLIEARVYKFSNGRIGSGIKAISALPQDGLQAAAMQAVDMMMLRLDKFAQYQIDEAYVAHLKQLVTNYSLVRAQIKDAINTRNLATRDRHEVAQAVYDDLVFFAQMGKTIYAGINEAKYNDYILGLSTSSKTQAEKQPEIPENVPPDDGTQTTTEATATAGDDSLVLKEPDYSQF